LEKGLLGCPLDGDFNLFQVKKDTNIHLQYLYYYKNIIPFFKNKLLFFELCISQVKDSAYVTVENIVAKVGGDWNWLVDGISGDVDTPNGILLKAKR